MAEKLTLTTAITETVRAALVAQTLELLPYAVHFGVGVDPVARTYQDEGSYIEAICLGQQGMTLVIPLAARGAPARVLVAQLNKANLSASSLLRRVLLQLQALDPVKYAGAVSGAPE